MFRLILDQFAHVPFAAVNLADGTVGAGFLVGVGDAAHLQSEKPRAIAAAPPAAAARREPSEVRLESKDN